MTNLDPALRIALSAALWVGLIVVLLRALLVSKHRTAGLPLALVLSVTLLHAGGLIHLNPAYDHTVSAYLASWSYTRATVASGAETTVLGILGFTFGALLANISVPLRTGAAQPPRPSVLTLTSKALMAVGVAATILPFIAGGVVAAIPGLSAIIGGFKNLLLLGISGFILHYVWMRQLRNALIAVIGAAAGVLVIQMFAVGILGDSVAATITVISFALVLFLPRLGSVTKCFIALGLASYVFLLAAVGWLDVRGEVRAAVWGRASLSERVDAFVNAGSKLKVFDGGYQTHLEYIDMRMNHNVTIGKAVERLSAFPQLYANGETLLLAAFGWVPRAIWPSKPTRGGSEMASIYTGQRLSDRTSFGTGPIFEFFINFGYWGVLIGGIAYGFILRWLDIRSARIFRDGDLLKASYFFSAGAAMIAPMNNLFFIVNGAVSSALAAAIVVFVLRRTVLSKRRLAITVSPRVL